MTETKILILGAGGNFGQLLLSRLRRSLAPGEATLIGIDRVSQPGLAEQPDLYVEADLMGEEAALGGLVAQADWILCALPEAATFRVIDTLLPGARPGALFVDILSVKTPVVERLEGAAGHLEVLSLHPMFAAGVDFPGQNVAAIAVRPGPRQERLTELLEGWGARLTWLGAEEHDVLTAVIQAATHASVLALAGSLDRLGYDLAKALPLATPPHRALLAMAARILGSDPEVYWKIQRSNPQASRAREALLTSLEDLDRAARDGDEASFRDTFARSRESMAPDLDRLRDLCRRLYSLPLDPGS